MVSSHIVRGKVSRSEKFYVILDVSFSFPEREKEGGGYVGSETVDEMGIR